MRNLPNKPAAPTPDPQSAVPSLQGGAAGVDPEVPRDDLSKGSSVGGARRAIPAGAVPVPRQFRVLTGGSVMYNNCRTAVRVGKILSEAQFDIALLRRQGIRLEEIPPDQVDAST